MITWLYRSRRSVKYSGLDRCHQLGLDHVQTMTSYHLKAAMACMACISLVHTCLAEHLTCMM